MKINWCSSNYKLAYSMKGNAKILSIFTSEKIGYYFKNNILHSSVQSRKIQQGKQNEIDATHTFCSGVHSLLDISLL